MIRLRNKGQPIFILMILLTVLISVPFQPALAALIETEAVINPDRVKDTRVLLNQLMAREDVRRELLSYGINSVEINARVAAMTDDEITTVVNTMKDMPAGGMDPWTELALICLALVILATFLILSLISGVVYAGIKVNEQREQKEQEYSKSTPYPATPRVGPLPTVNPNEPWTGKWKVTHGQFTGVYSLKQNGNTVISTNDSDHKIDAKVYGAMIWGNLATKQDFKATIAIDFLSFKGDVDSVYSVEGQRIEIAELKPEPTSIKVNPAEPWTGKWKVSSGRNPGIWSLTQNSDTVISTSDSDFKLEAKVYGAMIRGKWSTKGGADRDFQATIAKDGLSFNGGAEYTALRDYFTAKKIE